MPQQAPLAIVVLSPPPDSTVPLRHSLASPSTEQLVKHSRDAPLCSLSPSSFHFAPRHLIRTRAQRHHRHSLPPPEPSVPRNSGEPVHLHPIPHASTFLSTSQDHPDRLSST